jgi:hypothetical protein
MALSVQIIKVSPATAEALLKKNTRNRNINQRAVANLARTMANGEWVLNGEAIKIAWDGTVLDGQHRLSAIAQSGTTIETLVIEGLPNDAQDTMDTGRKRTTADVLAIYGEVNTNVMASVAKRAWMWESGNHKFATFSLPSTPEILAFIERFPSVRRSAEIGVRTNHHYRAAGASVTGTAHHILNQVDPAECAEFFARLANGADLTFEHPILTLRARLQRERDQQKATRFHVGVALYIRAWNAVREGRTLNQLIQPPEASMPMPV